MNGALELVFCVTFPLLTHWLCNNFKIFRHLSPVFICYAVGILIANLRLVSLDTNVITKTYESSVIIAIPLLLFGVQLSNWSKLSKLANKSLFIAIVAAILGGLLTAFIFREFKDVPTMTGMLMGIYVGGTANMQSVGIALNANEKIFLLLNAAEIVAAGLYLLFLLSIGKKSYSYFLPRLKIESSIDDDAILNTKISQPEFYDFIKALGASILVLLFTLGLAFVIWGNIKAPTFIIILITSLSLLLSKVKFFSGLKAAESLGHYLLLVFSLGIGLLADFREILSGSMDILVFTSVMLILILIIQLSMSWWLKIPGEYVILSSTATIFGPAFIGQIVKSLNEKSLMLPGMIMSLIGIALANYVGLATAYLLTYFMK